ncbi:hypothetical protein BTA35_0206210 [Oceanospirillum linum]|uniref:Uncharacterized protein n=1 Tax=Oceanospirillum linum TaxID=966 RepID=A0A1T1HCU5_OCELI|nr:hypothetical protein BTA35_0206210 [Oceanospirillum linum]
MTLTLLLDDLNSLILGRMGGDVGWFLAMQSLHSKPVALNDRVVAFLLYAFLVAALAILVACFGSTFSDNICMKVCHSRHVVRPLI